MNPDIKKAREFFEKVSEGSKEYSGIPDAGLQQKIKRVSEDAGSVVEHIKQKTDPKKG